MRRGARITAVAALLAGALWGAAAVWALAHGDEGAKPVTLKTAGQLRTVVAATLSQAGELAPASERNAISAAIIEPLAARLSAVGSIYYDISTIHEVLRYTRAKALGPEKRAALLGDVAVTVALGGLEVGTLKEYLERARDETEPLAVDVLALVREHVEKGHAKPVTDLLLSAEETGQGSKWLLARLQGLG